MAVPFLPTLKSVSLNNFSLYSRRPDLTVEFDRDVFCLAGANGLGKSTFLALVTYALTGRVPEPERSFQSIGDYIKDSRDFTKDYFRGRVDALDLEIASVRVTFDLGTLHFDLTRGFENPEDVLEVVVQEGSASVSLTEAQMELGLEERYQSLFCRASGLRDFGQFVFLQHFVLTFDERRHLLFWETRLTEPALFLSFGGDSELAARATKLRTAMDKQGSRARNSRWQATATRARIDALRSADQEVQSDFEELGDARLARVRAAWARRSEAEGRVAFIQGQIVAGHVSFGQASSSLADVARRLEASISSSDGRRDPWHHALVMQMRATAKCAACGASENILSHLAEAESAGRCPVCGDGLTDSITTLAPEVIELDAEATRLRSTVRDAEADLTRLTQRGLSLDPESEGQGIGLALVAGVADAAGGRLRMRNARPGLEVLLTLDLAAR